MAGKPEKQPPPKPLNEDENENFTEIMDERGARQAPPPKPGQPQQPGSPQR